MGHIIWHLHNFKPDPVKREVAPTTMTFTDAQTHCETLGKKLPVPSSADRIDEFKNEIFRTEIDFDTLIDISGKKLYNFSSIL